MSSSCVVVDTRKSQQARLRSVPLDAVTLRDEFWAPRREVNRTVMLPTQYQQCEDSGRIDNFRRASGRKNVPFQGIYFNDSDVYKWLEAAAWTLAGEDDPSLRATVDSLIDEIAAAQQEDGYLNTYFMFEKAAERWTNLRDMHELYCGGHMIQAAIACKRVLGDDRLLDVARRFADLICQVFGPKEDQNPGTCGHPEIEMALVELYRETGKERYLRLTEHFIQARGHGVLGGSIHMQDHESFRDSHDITGHAVRAVYLYGGASDVFLETGEQEYERVPQRLWRSMTDKRMYVSGGIGSRYDGEEFGEDYELPNARAYAETCAAIGSFMWNWRLLMTTGERRYADLMETLMYNAVIAGGSLDGETYFYQNPLADGGKHRRQHWFGCACCPPNLARFLASLPGYFYSTSPEGLWVHFYASGSAHVALENGESVELEQVTKYPYDGRITIRIKHCESKEPWTLNLRLPAWSGGGARAALAGGEGEEIFSVEENGYASVRCIWQSGDEINIDLPMPVRRVTSHPYVLENVGRVALFRGPLMYCFEGVDHGSVDLRDIALAEVSSWDVISEPEVLGGAPILKGMGAIAAAAFDRLYEDATEGEEERAVLPLTAVPYFAWANRKPGQMQVWMKE